MDAQAGSATVPPAWTDAATAPKPKPEPDVVEPVAAGYVGSRLSDHYHRPTCRNAKRIEAENQVFFPTVAAAREAGYHACRVCRPPTK
jgi:hypothetical protein